MNTRADSIRVVHPLFQAEGGGAIPTSALDLRIEPMAFLTAKELNRLWHSRLPRMGTGFIKNQQTFPCFGAECGGLWYAAAIWSNPVARKLPQQTWLELRRLAIAPDAPRNTASRMLAIMARLIHKARPEVEVLVSYQDTEVHTGGIYKAAGWVAADTTGSQRQWGCPSRPRPASQSDAVKVRWEKVLHARDDRTTDGAATADHDAAEPAREEADVPLPEGRADHPLQRGGAVCPSFWDAQAGDG